MAEQFQHDVLVIGSGPGGYVAAVRAAQLGFNTAIVEAKSGLGGTCLNVGCIPSKALLDSSERYHQARHEFSEHGIDVDGLRVDWSKMMARKQDVISKTTQGIDYLMSKNKIKVYNGFASFQDGHTVSIAGESGSETVTSRYIIVATGSTPASLPFADFSSSRIISSTGALALPEIPKHLIVVGGGVIGVELGSVYARLGAKVTIVEFMDRLLPTMDADLGKQLQKSLKGLAMEFHFKTKVTGVDVNDKTVQVTAENSKGETVSLEGDYMLLSIGRKPVTEGLNLDAAGVQVGERGDILIDNHFQTSCPSVYAIGDVVRGPMLAHKASEEGVACVEHLAGHAVTLNYLTVPGVVYTWPEVASVGYSEIALKEQGREYKVGKFPFKASGRARAAGDTDGFIKVLADKTTDEILGVHMIGARCSDMIAEAGLAIEYRASAEDIGKLIHAHPTFSEAVKEAALDANSEAIHF